MTIEGAVLGAEFVAMKAGVETLRGIRYKLRMMGAETDASKPESVLKKKLNLFVIILLGRLLQ